MKISGFTFIRNGDKLYYPVQESIRSVLEIVDEFVVALGDSDVDEADLAAFTGDWLGTETGSEKSDINNDGIVNLKDFMDIGENWE